MTEFILKAGASHQMYKSDNQGTDYDSISYMNWCCWSIYNGFILKIELILGLNIKCWNAKMFNKKWISLAYEKLTDAKMVLKNFIHERQKKTCFLRLILILKNSKIRWEPSNLHQLELHHHRGLRFTLFWLESKLVGVYKWD